MFKAGIFLWFFGHSTWGSSDLNYVPELTGYAPLPLFHITFCLIYLIKLPRLCLSAFLVHVTHHSGGGIILEFLFTVLQQKMVGSSPQIQYFHERC